MNDNNSFAHTSWNCKHHIIYVKPLFFVKNVNVFVTFSYTFPTLFLIIQSLFGPHISKT